MTLPSWQEQLRALDPVVDNLLGIWRPDGATEAEVQDMNRLALQAVAPGGIFLTCSCTGLVGEDAFLDMVRRAAWQAGRVVQVLRIAGAGADHPFLVHVPEGRYLKAVFCRVE